MIPGAVVIWFSDDPSLNIQSSHRLLEASDRLNVSDLVVIGNDFGRETFEAGKVYFLNTQKLSKSSLLVRGHEPDDDGIAVDVDNRPLLPDGRAFTIWDTIRNTIEDPALTLYLVLDEAHRGMGQGTTTQRDTIVRRLINGHRSVPGIPIVWGISATVERFNAAMAEMRDRATLPNVIVDAGLVQSSGLLKDTIILDAPDEAGRSKTVLVRRATDKLKEISDAWAAYAQRQNDPKPVIPLMVLQVEDTPNPDEISEYLDTIFQRWPDLPHDCVAHVFGEHKEQRFGRYNVPYIPPQRVQQSDWIRILIAKVAISTGWDCPRAEVMVSFRAARDSTYITQMLGRMIRSPLARRIPGDDRLNSVDCLLPLFERKSLEEIADRLMKGDSKGDDFTGRRVLVNPIDLHPNPAMPDSVWSRLTSLPSKTLPKRHSRPVKRLTILAHELAVDGLLEGAGHLAHAEMHKVLDGVQIRYADEIEAARSDVETVKGLALKFGLDRPGITFDSFIEEADYHVIEDAYRRAAKEISPDLARTYSEHLALKVEDELSDEALIEAHTQVAAMGLVSSIIDTLEAEADNFAKGWLDQFRIAIKNLSDERQDVYRQIREMSTDPMDIDLAQPVKWVQPTQAQEESGSVTDLPRYPDHLMCDNDGTFPVELSTSWEIEVVRRECSREGFVGWYRNPARSSQDSLGVTYDCDGKAKIMRPDFIFFSESSSGEIVADIVDPHGIQFADALPKLVGLADYAEEHGEQYRRIEAVAKVGEDFRVLDMKEASVRDATRRAESARTLYDSSAATDY